MSENHLVSEHHQLGASSSFIPRRILLTGGTGALGRAVTRRLLQAGHRVTTTWRVDHEREHLISELGRLDDQLLFVAADVTDPASVDSAIDEVAAQLGGIDAMVHLVGSWKGGEEVHEHSLETWTKMIEINLTSSFLCCRAALPWMRKSGWGRIVLVSARTARFDRSGQAAYSIAKAGVGLLAEVISEENRSFGVTANAVAPSILDTPANRAAMPEADYSTWVPPQDVAAAIEFLCSEEAGHLRGAWLPLTGAA
jgi:NAD(P)-dependent dehydrogenase (short-subunit alcohol dehydrogenase family)